MQCESESASVSPIHIDSIGDIGNIDSFDNIGNIGSIDDIGEVKTYCQRERYVPLSVYSSGSLPPIEDFETFHYSPLRGNFAS